MQKKLSKIFVLVDLLVQEIDEPIMNPTKETKMLQDKLRETQLILNPILDKFYNNEVVKSTFFSTMQNKFNYIFNKEYN
jgi:hypothetical protein